MTPGLIDPPVEFVDRIAAWFCASFADPYHNPRMAKSLGLYQLAAQVTEGALVELGTYQGNGAIALASGAPGRTVYTIDDYDHHVDWMGNEPGQTDLDLFMAHVLESDLNIVWVDQSAAQAGAKWDIPIGLLFWDTGTNALADDFAQWSSHLLPGGMFVMHDTDDFTFHSNEIVRGALQAGWQLGPQHRTLYTVIKPTYPDGVTP